MWIAFSLYLWNIEHNLQFLKQHPQHVVNCFQFVSLKYWAQPFTQTCGNITRCELLSVCIFEILSTTSGIYYDVLISCELLSVCIFEILSTTPWFLKKAVIGLWIAFSLYLWNIEHNNTREDKHKSRVVNCFQFVSLKYWAQLILFKNDKSYGCELLSVCIFEILSTTILWFFSSKQVLWIAFSLYLWNIEHNLTVRKPMQVSVVNCFQFVSLKYWAQQRSGYTL